MLRIPARDPRILDQILGILGIRETACEGAELGQLGGVEGGSRRTRIHAHPPYCRRAPK
jgi:hypothetical protein